MWRCTPPPQIDYAEYQDELQRAIIARGMPRRQALLRRGEAMLWAASLLHGGTPVLDHNRTRLSQATHYFFVPSVSSGGGAQTYWTPSVSRFEAREVKLKHGVGLVAPWAWPSGRAEKTAPPPTGYSEVDQARIDVSLIYRDNTTHFHALDRHWQLRCRQRDPQTGQLLRCGERDQTRSRYSKAARHENPTKTSG